MAIVLEILYLTIDYKINEREANYQSLFYCFRQSGTFIVRKTWMMFTN